MSILQTKPTRYLITRGDLNGHNFPTEKLRTLGVIRAATKVGIEMIQIREKNLEAGSLLDFVRDAANVTKGTETRLLVNERFDIGLAAGADGVHLTSRSIPVASVRRLVPKDFLIGVSTHFEQDVIEAKRSGADFAMFGSVFATPGKGDPKGLDQLDDICAKVAPFPVIAVGGIDGSNIQDVLDAGAAGYAAIRYLNEFVSIGE